MTLLWTITCKSEGRSKQEKEKERETKRQGRVELVKETRGDVTSQHPLIIAIKLASGLAFGKSGKDPCYVKLPFNKDDEPCTNEG